MPTNTVIIMTVLRLLAAIALYIMQRPLVRTVYLQAFQ